MVEGPFGVRRSFCVWSSRFIGPSDKKGRYPGKVREGRRILQEERGEEVEWEVPYRSRKQGKSKKEEQWKNVSYWD